MQNSFEPAASPPDATPGDVPPKPTPKPTPTPSVRPAPSPPLEFGGPTGPEPTRYGDWERNGRCIDF